MTKRLFCTLLILFFSIVSFSQGEKPKNYYARVNYKNQTVSVAEISFSILNINHAIDADGRVSNDSILIDNKQVPISLSFPFLAMILSLRILSKLPAMPRSILIMIFPLH